MLIGLETSKIVAATLDLQLGSRVLLNNTWYPVHASSKKQNIVCLSSGESEADGTGWWSLRGYRNERTNGARCATVHLIRLFCARTAQQLWDS